MEEIRRQIRSEAIEVIKRFGKGEAVALQVEALIGSLDDTLSDEVILEELRAMKASGLPFVEVFASVVNTRKSLAAYSPSVLEFPYDSERRRPLHTRDNNKNIPMKTNSDSGCDSPTPRNKQRAVVASGRWVAYAAAAASTALAASNSAEASIHYSGLLNEHIGSLGPGGSSKTFPLDRHGDSFVLENYFNSLFEGIDFLYMRGIASAAFRGSGYYVSKLYNGQRISSGAFLQASRGVIAGTTFGQYQSGTQWRRLQSTGFIGFRFNNGAGVQYGWARLRIVRDHQWGFPMKMFDYAYADPGEPIRAGQTSSDEKAPDQGSLGWLALGAAGLLAWRKRRSRPAGSEDA